MNVRGLGWLGVRTDRYPEMTRFCREVLGLAEVRDDGGFAIFDTAEGDAIELFGRGAPTGPGQFDANKIEAGFVVDDLSGATRELVAAGTELLGERNDAAGSSWQHFRAPDGNVYELKEIHAQRPRTWPADWAERMRGVGCGMCREGRPEETKAGSRIFAGAVSDAYLIREDWVKGYTVVIWRGSHAAEIDDLSDVDMARYWSEVARVGRALREHFRPAKLNYQVLGNSLPHVHTHIVPRYLDDPAPGRPLPFPDPRRPAQPEERSLPDVAQLRRILA